MSRFAQSCQIGIKQASEEYWSSSVTKSWATVTYAKRVTLRKGNFVHQRILLRWFSMFCVSRNAYKMIIVALSTWFLWFCGTFGCCVPQQIPHRKAHTRYVAPSRHQGWWCNYCYPNGLDVRATSRLASYS